MDTSSNVIRAHMDLAKTIQELRSRKELLERAIAKLEQLQGPGSGVSILLKRRGRKSMGPEERQNVSDRSKLYWAKRRQQRESDSPSETEPVEKPLV